MSLFDVPEEVLNARPQGAKDFDFLQGRWLIHHKKLAERLVGCQTWQEFQTPAANQLILGGLGNIDHLRIESGDFYEGASLRLFDKASRLWRIYWMDTNGATLFPPVEGSFSDTVGLFRGHDQHNGIPVLVEFRWDKTNPEGPTWQQSFSVDDGNTWEVNWYMYFSRERYEHVYAIVRHDRFLESPELSFTVKEVVRTQAMAEAEVNRLNELNADKNCTYFWQVTRLFPEGQSAGHRRSETA